MTLALDNTAIMAQLKSERAGLIQAKSGLETQLAEIKARCSTRLPQYEYHRLQQERTELVRQMGNIQSRFGAINEEISKLALEENAANQARRADRAADAPSDLVSALSALRQEYQEFSADTSRISSMRAMASEFVLKLNPIIKKAVNP